VNLIDMALYIVVPLLSVTVLLGFVRLVIGPSLPDRVVAMDLLSTVGIGVIAVYTISSNEPVFVDVAIILALVAFLGTVAFAYYIEKRGEKSIDEKESESLIE
jgi:multicomponent Na+:H+ antiporter subunit F